MRSGLAPQKKTMPRGNAARTIRRGRRSRYQLLERIVRAASEEFTRHGYAGAKTAAIARKADVTEAQLYRYFGSKANLFREAIFKPLDRHFLKFVNKHFQEFGAAVGAREITRRYTSELQHFIREHSDAITSLILAQAYESGSGRRAREIKSLAAYFDRCAAVTRQRMKVEPRIDPRLVARVSFVAVLGCVLFKEWIFPPRLASDREITAAISDFVLGAISAGSVNR